MKAHVWPTSAEGVRNHLGAGHFGLVVCRSSNRWAEYPTLWSPQAPPPMHTTSCWSMSSAKFIVAFQRKLEENTHTCIFSKSTLGRVCRIGCSSSKLCSGQPILPLPPPISSVNSCSSHSHTSGIIYIREILPHHMKCLCSLQRICWVGWIGYIERSR